MKSKNEVSLGEIENLVKLGSHEEALKLLDAHRLLKSWTILEKIRAADLYKRMGEVAKAIKVLPDEVSLNEIITLDKNQLFAQIRLAEILNFVGAKYVSERIIHKTLAELKTKKISLEKEYPEVDFHLADIYLSRGDFDSAKKFYEKALNDPALGSYRNNLATVGKADCLSALGENDLAISILEKLIKTITPEEAILKGIIFQAIGEYCFKSENLETAGQYFQKSHEFFGKDVQTKDMAYLLKWYGALKFKQNRMEEAKSFLASSFIILNQHLAQPMALIDLLYWYEKLSIDYEFGFKIASRCHYTHAPVSFLLGKQLDGNSKYPLPDWYKNLYHPHENNCWLIEEEKIQAIRYEDFRSRYDLDLMSGCFKTKDKLHLLTEIQRLCLLGIISTGSLGIHEIALVDFVYRQEMYHLKSGEERIKELIKTMRNLGFKIIKSKNYYSFDFSFEGTICLPMDLFGYGYWVLFKKFYPKFKRQDLESFFNLSTSTSKEYISKWSKLNIISAQGAGPSTKYFFN